MVKMIEYEGEMVPEECCTVARDGIADDFTGCGNCFFADTEENTVHCESCIVNRIFQEYAKLTNQCDYILTLPIKKKWFDMILSGEKKEEYREIKPYYDTRFIKWLGFPKSEVEDVKELLKKQETKKRHKIVFRNGYSRNAPSITANCTLSIRTGKEEWGAAAGKEYYVLKIHEIK